MLHIPVMVEECLRFLDVRPDGVYTDCTAGLGNHTLAIARLLDTGRVIAIDRDAETLEMARRSTAECGEKITFVRGRFSELPEVLARLGVAALDGLLADLGASRYQLTTPERGFSFMADGPLDLRMDRSRGVTAATLVNTMTESKLADLIYEYGQERSARRVAKSIVQRRPIRTTGQLTAAIESVLRRTGRLHPATKTYLALRLKVNEELEELDALLEAAPGLMRPGGRIVVLSFMSHEDGRVKRRFRELAREGRASVLTKHVITPGDDEVRRNPAARSARMRSLEIRRV